MAHTIKKKTVRVEHTRVRHRDEKEMQAVEDKVEEAGMEETKKIVVMY